MEKKPLIYRNNC